MIRSGTAERQCRNLLYRCEESKVLPNPFQQTGLNNEDDNKKRVFSGGRPICDGGFAGGESHRWSGTERSASHNFASRTAAPRSATAVCGFAFRHVRAFQYGDISGPRMG